MATRSSSGAPPSTAESRQSKVGKPKKRLGKKELVTVTARLIIDMERVSQLESWADHELVKHNNRVKDENILYAASRDGYSNELFHTQCDGKAPTIVFVLLGNKRLFGGYTRVPWSSANEPRVDRSAFLFSLSDGGERPALILKQVANAGYAVNHYKDRGPLFGVGCGSDLGLNLDEDKLSQCRSCVGSTYAIPRASARDPVVSDTFLAGRLDGWDIEDVVVYHCAHVPVDEPVPGSVAGSGSVRESRASSRFPTAGTGA